MKGKDHYKDCEYLFVTGRIGGYWPLFAMKKFSHAFINIINKILESYGVTMAAWVIMQEHYHFHN